MPQGKEQRLHLIVKRPNQCCQVGFCSARGLQPQPQLPSKMLLFLQVASAGCCRGLFKPAKAKSKGSFSHVSQGSGSWGFLILLYSSSALQNQCPQESGISLLPAALPVGSSESPKLFHCCFTGTAGKRERAWFAFRS